MTAMALCVGAASAQAQVLRSSLVAEGLSSPVGFVQDPSNPNVQFIVQQAGVIRTFVNGVVGGSFLSLAGQVAGGGEQGLLGLAFAPDYAMSRRFFVNFVNLQGDTVIARFRRDPVNPLLADPLSRFDLRWPDGNAFIVRPGFGTHNGGNLEFGADGYLYIGTGDGGAGNDPGHRAQTPGTLLGKMLRIDVNVPDIDPQGYDVPPDNPFLGDPAVLPEIWAFGLRNPWRYTRQPRARRHRRDAHRGCRARRSRRNELRARGRRWPELRLASVGRLDSDAGSIRGRRPAALLRARYQAVQ
jgi:glucose/arabinose dehydrogenase